MLHYYQQLFDNPHREQEIISWDLRAIEDYLSRAIEALKKKEDICARWCKLDETRAELKLQGALYRIPKEEIVVSEALRDYQAGDSVDVRGGKYQIKQKLDVNKAIFFEPYKGELIFSGDNTLCEGEIEYSAPRLNIVLERDSDYMVYFRKGELCSESKAQQLTDDETKVFLSELSHISYNDNNYRIEVDSDGCLLLREDFIPLLNKPLVGIPYSLDLMLVSRSNKGRGEGRWIQLLEVDSDGNEDETLSPLRYFFDDDVSIKDDKGNDYLVYKQARSEDYQLRLQKRGENRDCYPPDGALLKVKVNAYQLYLQREAVRLLRARPLKEHLPLLNLFRNKQDVYWESYPLDYPSSWLVLRDNHIRGCKEQRNFVAKAINTPDFAFLAGPPGSGKTTVIIELIGQLISQGKRVLLCGSTHVAIDNVLERLDEKGLIDNLEITALRIGDKGRISEKVKHFQIDEVLRNCPEAIHRLVRESANLVCGTTIGILQHPDFKRERNDFSPIKPEFDYLIIDESSKTTFQEFLVPALHARRWVLVGDVMQLSPYTERELVEANIRQISIKKEESLSEAHQQAIYLLLQLESLFKRGGRETLHGHYAIPVSQGVLTELKKEYDAGRGCDTFDDVHCSIAFVTRDNYRDYSRLRLSDFELIFIDKDLVSRGIIPETHAVLWDKVPKDWQSSEHSFLFRVIGPEIASDFRLEERGSYQTKRNLETFCQEIANRLYIRSWAGEVAWRIDREHQIRLQNQSSQKFKKSYSEQIKELMPTQDRGLWISAINRIASIAYPSILEALERGIISISKREFECGDRSSTLVEGFDRPALNERREILTYQHRMHPELSYFPRSRFYYARPGQAEALCDNPKMNRDWAYQRYPHRNHWIEVEGKTYRGINEREAEVVMGELDKFVEYAQRNPPSDNPQRRWEVACLTFYRGQERKLRELLCRKTNSQHSTHFEYKGVGITLCTVDRFQGQEADIVFLSMVQTQRVGFIDSPNRLNVALTRARYQNVIIGNQKYFLRQKVSEDLQQLASLYKR